MTEHEISEVEINFMKFALESSVHIATQEFRLAKIMGADEAMAEAIAWGIYVKLLAEGGITNVEALKVFFFDRIAHYRDRGDKSAEERN